jgi:hypothetical protein
VTFWKVVLAIMVAVFLIWITPFVFVAVLLAISST